MEKGINKIAKSSAEKEELWDLVDGLIHQRVLTVLLDKMDEEHHEEFIVRLYDAPHDEGIWEYLKEKLSVDVVEIVKQEIAMVGAEVMRELKSGQLKMPKVVRKSKKKKRK